MSVLTLGIRGGGLSLSHSALMGMVAGLGPGGMALTSPLTCPV